MDLLSIYHEHSPRFERNLEAADGDALREGVVGVVDREPDHLAVRIHLQDFYVIEVRISMLFY